MSAAQARRIAWAALGALAPAEADEPLAAALRQAQDAAWPSWLDAETEPWQRLATQLALGRPERLALALALAAQLDPLLARAIGWLEGRGAQASPPSLGLLALAGAPLQAEADTLLLGLLQGPAQALELLQLGPEALAAERSLQLPALLLAGLLRAEAGEAGKPPGAQLLPGLQRLQAGAPLLLRAADPLDLEAAADRLAAALGRPLLRCKGGEWPTGAALAAAQGWCLPCFALGAGERLRLPAPATACAWLGLVAGDAALHSEGETPAELPLPPPQPAARARHWQRPEPSPRCGPARLRLLQQLASWRGRSPDALLQAQAQLAQADFEGLAQVLPPREPQLVLTAATERALQQLLARCRVREQLRDAAAGAPRAAVCALFSGGSGTGKTLAAAWLARRLNLPLVRVDLGQVSSKWIGETEKNLARLFAAAEASGALLLFDEADALFGRRTETRDSHDRYANQQTNYLLTRLEAFDGIAVLTSNAREQFDGAFARRLDALIEFRLPAPPERERLWRMQLGDAALSAAGFTRLAQELAWSGGQIRAAALQAQALALDAGAPLTWSQLLDALRAESLKLGQPLARELEVAP